MVYVEDGSMGVMLAKAITDFASFLSFLPDFFHSHVSTDYSLSVHNIMINDRQLRRQDVLMLIQSFRDGKYKDGTYYWLKHRCYELFKLDNL